MHIGQLSQTVQFCLSIASGILGLMSGGSYIRSTIKKETDPRPISWLGWSILMGVSVISQIIEKGIQWNQTGIILSTLTCLIVTKLAWKNGKILPGDRRCLLFGMICLAVYLTTKNALITTILAIIADFVVAIPTLHNAYKHRNEKSIAWYFSGTAWFVTTINCTGYNIVYYLFPVYLFLFAITMLIITHRKIKEN